MWEMLSSMQTAESWPGLGVKEVPSCGECPLGAGALCGIKQQSVAMLCSAYGKGANFIVYKPYFHINKQDKKGDICFLSIC